ncbi:DsbA family protein [Bacillus mycoides]
MVILKTKIRSKSKQLTKWIFLGVVLVSAALLVLIFWERGSEKEVHIDYQDQPYLGKESAPVHIVEFGDYKCPACKKFSESTFYKIKKDLIDTGKAKFYFMNYAFINVDSIRAAKFGETVYKELGNEKFWQFHELLYNKQPKEVKYEGVDLYTNTFLKDTLKEFASDEEVAKVVENFNLKKAEYAYEKDMSYIKKFKINSAPALYINGKRFEGDAYIDLKKIVEKAIKEDEKDE